MGRQRAAAASESGAVGGRQRSGRHVQLEQYQHQAKFQPTDARSHPAHSEPSRSEPPLSEELAVLFARIGGEASLMGGDARAARLGAARLLQESVLCGQQRGVHQRMRLSRREFRRLHEEVPQRGQRLAVEEERRLVYGEERRVAPSCDAWLRLSHPAHVQADTGGIHAGSGQCGGFQPGQPDRAGGGEEVLRGERPHPQMEEGGHPVVERHGLLAAILRRNRRLLLRQEAGLRLSETFAEARARHHRRMAQLGA